MIAVKRIWFWGNEARFKRKSAATMDVSLEARDDAAGVMGDAIF